MEFKIYLYIYSYITHSIILTTAVRFIHKQVGGVLQLFLISTLAIYWYICTYTDSARD